MSGEIAILTIAVLAVVLDLLHSVVSIPNVVAMGLSSSLSPDEEVRLRNGREASGDAVAIVRQGVDAGDSVNPEILEGADEQQELRGESRPEEGMNELGATSECGVFYFAIQNNEEVPVEWGGRTLDVLLTIRGDGLFRQEQPVLLTSGPDDEVSAWWSTPGSEIVLSIPSMRPLKTWVIRCYVEPHVTEMSLSMRTPTRSTVRRLAQKINATLFSFHNLDYHQTFVLTRKTEDTHYSSRPFRRLRGLAWTIIPSSVVGGAAYYWFLGKLSGDFANSEHAGLLRFLVDGRVSGLFDIGLILVGSALLYVLSQAREMPIAQGYQEVRSLMVAQSKPPEKSGLWSPRWTSKWGD